MRHIRPKNSPPRITVQIRISESERDKLQRLARKLNLTVTQLLLSGVDRMAQK